MCEEDEDREIGKNRISDLDRRLRSDLEYTPAKKKKVHLSSYVGRGAKLFHSDAKDYVRGLRSDDRIQERSLSPNMLAKKAKSELRRNGKTAILCPRCNTVPTITMTPKGERTIVSCECGYVHDVDINF